MKHNKEDTEVEPSTKQDGETQSTPPTVLRDENGRILPGSKLNPEGTGGFADNPEHRSDGTWKKEKTPRAKLEKMLEEMTVAEIMVAKLQDNSDTNLSAKVGDIAASGRLLNVFEFNDTSGKIAVNSKEFDSLMYFVFGSKSENETTLKEDGIPSIKGFVIPVLPENFIDADIEKQMKEQGIDKLPS